MVWIGREGVGGFGDRYPVGRKGVDKVVREDAIGSLAVGVGREGWKWKEGTSDIALPSSNSIASISTGPSNVNPSPRWFDKPVVGQSKKDLGLGAEG